MAFDGQLTQTMNQTIDFNGFSLDDGAFARLWSEQRGRLLSLANRMTGNPADAEEVVQEAFLQAWRARGRFAGQSRPSTWLHRIAHNAALMHLRSRRRRPLDLVGDGLTALEARAPLPGRQEAVETESAVIAGERRQILRGAVDRLPARDRALVLSVLADRDDDVDGGRADSACARKSRLTRARARLRCDQQLAAVI